MKRGIQFKSHRTGEAAAGDHAGTLKRGDHLAMKRALDAWLKRREVHKPFKKFVV